MWAALILCMPPHTWADADSKGNGKTQTSSEEGNQAGTTKEPTHVIVVAVAVNRLSLDVTTNSSASCRPAPNNVNCTLISLSVSDNTIKDQLKQFRKGDHIEVVYSVDTSGKKILKAWCVDSVDVPRLSRLWVVLASAGACLLLYLIFSGFHPSKIIIGQDNRYSNSKFQIALWFFVLISTYIAALWLRVRWAGWDFLGGIDIPKNLLLLSGLSALTFGGAKGITTGKQAAAAAAPPGTPGVARKTKGTPNFFSDLTHDDGDPTANPPVPPRFDFGDFQMLVVTLIAVVTYAALIFNSFGAVEYVKSMNLPDVDTTILALFGLGQGAYLTKKAVGEPGKS
jgi:hypothetical protein